MATLTLCVCDRCKGEFRPKNDSHVAECRVFFPTGRGFDGVESFTDGRFTELCHACAILLVREILKHLSYEDTKKYLDWATHKIEVVR